jgi:hypothetical protein
MTASSTYVVMLGCAVIASLGFTPGISPGGGGGVVVVVVEPTVGTSVLTDPEVTPGISPANAVLASTHASVIAINSLFMKFSFEAERPM